jgi:hypothetical protein
MDKRLLVKQLADKLSASAKSARLASRDAAEEAREGATPHERREDSRVAIENQSLALGQEKRAALAAANLAALEASGPEASRPTPAWAWAPSSRSRTRRAAGRSSWRRWARARS